MSLNIGIFGCGRGRTCAKTVYGAGLDIRVSALCDADLGKLNEVRGICAAAGDFPAVYTDAEEFLSSGKFDAVVLCNYFHEHAPAASRLLRAGYAVLSETAAAGTMSEAVGLCEAAEESRAVYMMAENYPYTKSNFELKRLYESGTLGKLVFAEGEYVHPVKPPAAPPASPGTHWRTFLPVTYYCSHSIGPLIFMTGELPVRVTAMAALDDPERAAQFGRIRPHAAGIMMVRTTGGAVMRVAGSCYMSPRSNWFRLSCTEGSAETVRGLGSTHVRLCYNEWSLPEGVTSADRIYEAEWAEDGSAAEGCGHCGGDYWVMRYFLEACEGKRVPFPDVYTACSMSALGILGWRSVQNGGMPFDIPDFRDRAARARFADDRLSPFPPHRNI
ncbi:MAG: Gfo/Idh/MocA family oxidoreductase [Clostridia bacterium]|nr:Gfo/Idh/MocA family oxidoreductase [Clostridia bacterium]